MHDGVAGCVRVSEANGCGSRKSYWDIVRSVEVARTVKGADDGANERERNGLSDDVIVFAHTPCSKSHDRMVESKLQL